jgi:hypothetical protein
MRTTLLALLAVLLGVALGAGTAVWRIRLAPWDSRRDESAPSTSAAAPAVKEPQPKVVVDATEYSFGTLDVASSGSHDFVFANEGDGPLVLSVGKTSCRCTTSKLDRQRVPPGGSTKVTLTWKAADNIGPYTQTASILTNDPVRPQVTLAITGQITARARFVPTNLVFTRLTAGESATGQARLFCYLEKPLKIVGHAWSDAATAPLLEAAWQPLSAAELKDEPLARSGWLVKVTLKPGLPQGLLAQRLVLRTDLPALPEMTLPVEALIGSEIAIVGQGWNPETGVLDLGEVSRQTGLQRRLMLVVRGPLRKQVAFKPVTVVPAVLKVSLGQRSEINQGTVAQVPLTIDIPKGSPPANHLGSEQGQFGEIVLETTHPKVPKLRILVRFAIEG